MCENFHEFKSSCVQIFVFLILWFLFSCFGLGSWKSRKFGPCKNFLLYGTTARIAMFYISTNFTAWTVTLNDQEKITGQQLLCILSHVRLELSSLYTYVQRPTYMPSYLLRILLHEHEGLTFVSQMGRWETLGQRVCLGGCCCTLLSIVGQHFCIGEEYILSQL